MNKISARHISGIEKRWSDCYRILPDNGRLKALSERGMTLKERCAVHDSYSKKHLDKLFLDHFCEYSDLRENSDETASLWTIYMESFGCVSVTVPRKYRRRHPTLLDANTEYVRIEHPYHPHWEDFWVPEDFAMKSLLMNGFPLSGKELRQKEIDNLKQI